jgi:hypothetical protein
MDSYGGWGGEGDRDAIGDDDDAYAGDIEDTGMESRRSSRVRKPTTITNIGPQESSRKPTSTRRKATSTRGKSTSTRRKPTSTRRKSTSTRGKSTSTRRRVQSKLLKPRKEDGKYAAASKTKEEERLSRYRLHTPQEARRKTMKQKRLFIKIYKGETLTPYEENMIKSAKQILHIMKPDTTGKYAEKIALLRDLYYVKFGFRYEEVIQKLIDTGKLSRDLREIYETRVAESGDATAAATSTDPIDDEISDLLVKLAL